MKSTFQSLTRCQTATAGLLLAVAIFVASSTNAQNLLRNPDFESPLGPDNWTVAYQYGGPGDLSIADRTIYAARGPWGGGGFGAHFRSVHDGLVHAYFTQTVTNLTPGTSYILSGYMKYWEYTFELNEKFNVWFDAVGGQGTNQTPSITVMDDANLKTNTIFRLYSVTNTADANGQIEVRLHMADNGTTVCCDKLYYRNGMWDDMSLTLAP
jgi:hypothetical protein